MGGAHSISPNSNQVKKILEIIGWNSFSVTVFVLPLSQSLLQAPLKKADDLQIIPLHTNSS